MAGGYATTLKLILTQLNKQVKSLLLVLKVMSSFYFLPSSCKEFCTGPKKQKLLILSGSKL